MYAKRIFGFVCIKAIKFPVVEQDYMLVILLAKLGIQVLEGPHLPGLEQVELEGSHGLPVVPAPFLVEVLNLLQPEVRMLPCASWKQALVFFSLTFFAVNNAILYESFCSDESSACQYDVP